MSGGSLMLDYNFKVHQHQLYLNSNFFPGMGITITPAFHFLQYSMNYVIPEYQAQQDRYLFPEYTIKENNFIGYLGINKDFGILHAGIFGAAANLNEQNQYQAGFDLMSYPLGNLNMYIGGQFVSHFNDGEIQPVWKVTGGGKIVDPIWIQLSGNFGEVKNFFEKNASAVYNFPDRVRFKYEAKLIALLGEKFLLTLDYQYIGKKAHILTYRTSGSGSNVDYLPEVNYKEYTDQFLIGSILWKL
jgi:hypothetical protein